MVLIFFIIALLFFIAAALYWALRIPEDAFAPGRKRRALKGIAGLFLAIALVGVFSKEHAYSMLFFAYPLTYAVLFRQQARSILAHTWEEPPRLFLILFALLWIQELFVVGDGADPLVAHMVGYAGFYIGLALTIFLIYRRWTFTAPELLVVGGLWGVLIEQEFAGPAMLLSGDILTFLFFGPFAFIVYGLYLVGPYLLFYEEFKERGRTYRWQRWVLFLAVTVVPLLTWFAWSLALDTLGIELTGLSG